MVDPAGLEPARVSLQTRCTATRALGPGSRWVESNDRRQTPRGLQPRSSNQQRSPGRDRSVWRRRIDVAPIPNLAYYLVVNVRCLIADLGKKGKASPSRGGRSRTHVRRFGAGCPFRWTTPLRVCGYAVVRLVREYKRAAPFRKRLLNEQDVCKSLLCR